MSGTGETMSHEQTETSPLTEEEFYDFLDRPIVMEVPGVWPVMCPDGSLGFRFGYAEREEPSDAD